MSEATTTTATVTPVTPVTETSRAVRITVRVLQILLAVLFAVPSASPKLIGHSSAAEGFDKIGFGDWFMYLVGGLELAGAIALLIPVLSGVAALALGALMVGAFVTQLMVFDGQNAATPLIVLVPLMVIAWNRRQHLVPVLRRTARRQGRPSS
ncbi:DoxX family protein [Streptomyces sp. ISL-100]|uniref:DoxX family protein n=1 Tax=Streptomyces sp. ISL-100 TaxID=2819173 RepID=UPI001BEB96A2|nr:DoxX family protein [Streptomyces sp. ISL-100]MBT2397737.1 DoxX family protein [Streptomyces sp. ISL-100]